MSILDQILDEAKVVSSQHDINKIFVSEGDISSAIRALSGPRGWDAAEYGLTQAQVEQQLRAADTPQARERVLEDLKQRAIARAGLDVTTGEIAVVFAKDPGWHKLGTVLSKAFKSGDIKKMPALNWLILKEAMAYRGKDSEWVESDDVFSLKRADTGAKLGTTGSRYKVIQNWEAWDFLDDVVGEFGARYESVGSVYGGKQCWAQIHMPKQAFAVGSHTHVEPFVTFFKKNDGSGEDKCFPTGIRTECANTLRQGVRGAKGKGIGIRHTGDIKAKIKAARKALGLSIEAFEEFKDNAAILTATKLPTPQLKYYVNDVLDAALDITAADALKGADVLAAALKVTEAQRQLELKSIQKKIDNREDILEDILRRHDSRTNNGIRGTAFGVLNAVTESADHGKLGGRYKGDTEKRASRQFLNVIQGAADDVKQIAYEKALSLTA